MPFILVPFWNSRIITAHYGDFCALFYLEISGIAICSRFPSRRGPERGSRRQSRRAPARRGPLRPHGSLDGGFSRVFYGLLGFPSHNRHLGELPRRNGLEGYGCFTSGCFWNFCNGRSIVVTLFKPRIIYNKRSLSENLSTTSLLCRSALCPSPASVFFSLSPSSSPRVYEYLCPVPLTVAAHRYLYIIQLTIGPLNRIAVAH